MNFTDMIRSNKYRDHKLAAGCWRPDSVKVGDVLLIKPAACEYTGPNPNTITMVEVECISTEDVARGWLNIKPKGSQVWWTMRFDEEYTIWRRREVV